MTTGYEVVPTPNPTAMEVRRGGEGVATLRRTPAGWDLDLWTFFQGGATVVPAAMLDAVGRFIGGTGGTQ
jgi:hypothetical protein